MSDRKIAVAMSGGVDSSVAAGLLANRGQDVFGVMMRLWNPSQDNYNRCCSPADLSNAKAVAASLDIPFYVLDMQDDFKTHVVDSFIYGYAHGVTPNPCIQCNRIIRWDLLLKKVLAMGATHLATGHYARVSFESNVYHLLRAKDRFKDQSYVLSVLGQDELSKAVFPLGELTKDQVRSQAREMQLSVADRADSQDLCFIGNLDYRTFLEDFATELPPPGPILDPQGRRLGQHEGLANFTIGQRKGIGLTSEKPLYVISKDFETNALTIGERHELGRDTFIVKNPNWIQGAPPSLDESVLVRVRYKAQEVEGTVVESNPEHATIRLAEMLPDVTPGQSAVFYRNEECLGGGIIAA